MGSEPREGRLIIISGPSGVGKGTICKRMLEKEPKLALSVSATTRKIGPGEEEGREYFFYSKEKFQSVIQEDGFLEWAEIHGNLYGTPRQKVEEYLKEGRDVILEIDVQGGLQVQKKLGSRCIMIFVVPPSQEELLRRIYSRNREKPEEIALRMKTAQWEMAQEEKYQYTVVNDDLEVVVDKIFTIIREEKKEHASTFN
ncbi:MAG: guanylate kinase [Peptococcaceae bacterium]|nr:guanylate kinase [Peptococcaceae bacterium]